MANSLRSILRDLAPKVPSAAELIASSRKRMGLSIDDVSELTGLSNADIELLENGTKAMSLETAEVLAAIFDLHPSSLLFPDGRYGKSKAMEALTTKAKRLLEVKKSANK